MKLEKITAALTAAVLSALLSIAALGCLITGFRLELSSANSVFFLCAAGAVLFSWLFSQKWGMAAAACLMALAAGFLWHRGTPWDQTRNLLVYISKFYHGAYQWGYFLFAPGTGPFDAPLATLGCLISLVTAGALVRQRSVILPLSLAALPPAACMVVTDTVPQARWLFLFLAAFLLILLPQTLRRENLSQGTRLTLLAAVPVVLSLVILFYAFPEDDYVNRSKELQTRMLTFLEELPQKAREQAHKLSSGLPSDSAQTLDLKRMGARPRYPYPVLTLTVPESGSFYLRGQDYDAYTGTGWTASPHRAEVFGSPAEALGTAAIVTRTKKELLFLPYYPTESQTLAGGSLKNTERIREYQFSYAPAPEPIQEEASSRIQLTELEISQFGSTADRLRYLTLPGQTKVRAQAILETILPEEASRQEQAQAIADFVRNTARYDRSTGPMPEAETDFSLWFLESADTGYCVHFATAAVVLLRAADIPARYVSGYLAQTQAGEAVTVTGEDAHAWAEYYSPLQQCWLPLEATPAQETVQPVPGTEPEASEITAPLPVPGEDPAAPTLPIPENGSPEGTQPPAAPPPPVSRSARFPLLLLSLLAAAGLLLQRRLRLLLRQRQLARSGPNRQALLLWQQSVLLSKLLRQSPPEALHRLAQKAKYSPHTLTEEELRQFHSHITQAHRILKNRPWYLQILYRLVYAVY